MVPRAYHRCHSAHLLGVSGILTLVSLLSLLLVPGALTPSFAGDPPSTPPLGGEAYIASEEEHDFDVDFISDVVIASPAGEVGQGGIAGGQEMPGKVEIYSVANEQLIVRITGREPGDRFGYSVAVANEISGDRYKDLIIGAPYDGGPGRVYTFNGPFGAPSEFDLTTEDAVHAFSSSDIRDYHFGERVGQIYDLDGDSVKEIRMRAWFLDEDENEQSHSYIASGLNGSPLYVITGNDPFDPWAVVPGDADEDGDVDNTDLRIVQQNWGLTGRPGSLGPGRGDLNGDGIVDGFDMALVNSNFGNRHFAGFETVPGPPLCDPTVPPPPGMWCTMNCFFQFVLLPKNVRPDCTGEYGCQAWCGFDICGPSPPTVWNPPDGNGVIHKLWACNGVIGQVYWEVLSGGNRIQIINPPGVTETPFILFTTVEPGPVTVKARNYACYMCETEITFNISHLEGDSDGDGILDDCENHLGTNPLDYSSRPNINADPDHDLLTNGQECEYLTNHLNSDTDQDRMADYWEILHGFDPHDPSDGSDTADADGDGVPNFLEYLYGSNPHLHYLVDPTAPGPQHDSDNDGFIDWIEQQTGSDWANPLSMPMAVPMTVGEMLYLAGPYGVYQLNGSGMFTICEGQCFRAHATTSYPEWQVIQGNDIVNVYVDPSGCYSPLYCATGSGDIVLASSRPPYGSPLPIMGYIHVHVRSEAECQGGCELTINGGPGGLPDHVCVGQQFNLTASGGSGQPGPYQWTVLEGASFVGTPNPQNASGASVTLQIDSPGMILISVTRGECGKTKEITALGVDLRIDSNNDGEIDDADEEIEDDPELPGKIIFVNRGDFDDDGVPDFADGIDVHGNAGGDACHPFVPIVLDLSQAGESKDLIVAFTYSSSDPATVLLDHDTYGDPRYQAAPGTLRIWAKNAHQSRLSASLAEGGDYVASGVEYSVSELGGAEAVTIYVEAVRESGAIADQQIQVLVRNGDNCEQIDAVRITVIPRVLWAYRNTDSITMLGLRFQPIYSDGLSAVGQELAGTMHNEETLLQVGADRPNPNASSLSTMDMESFRLRIKIGEDAHLPIELSPVLITLNQNPDDFYTGGSVGGIAGGSPPNEPGDWVDPNPGDLDPNGFDAEFELFLSDKYDNAEPSIEWLEREAWEIRGLMYGGRSWQWFSGRDVWRDGNLIYVEDSLTPEQAADSYYQFLKDLVGPNSNVTLTKFARHVGEIHNLNDSIMPGTGNRSDVGAYLGKNWGLVDMLATDLQTEVYTVGTGFVVGGVLGVVRAKNVRFNAGEGMQSPAYPLHRRNWIRGKIVEDDTIVKSLGRHKYSGPALQGTVDGSSVNTVPDGLYSTSLLENKDVLKLSRQTQIRAQIDWCDANGKTFVLITTTRTKKMTAPMIAEFKLLSGSQHPNRFLLRRNVNSDTYYKWQFNNNTPYNPNQSPENIAQALAGNWVPISKAQAQSILGP